MLNGKKVVEISELKAGMIAAKDVYDRKNMLLAKDFVITKSAIEKLKKTYIVESIEVYIDNAVVEKEVINTLSFNLKRMNEVENVLNKFSIELEGMFKNLANSKKADMDELREFTKNIQNEFTTAGTILKNIAFKIEREEDIYRHSINVAAISFILGKWLGINGNELNLLIYSAVLHDFGKTKIDKRIIDKGTSLTLDEYNIYKTHPVIGYEFMKKIPYLDPSVGYGILMHHERMDGSGYPLGITGDKIHKFSKIIAIADLFDEVSSGKYSNNIRGPFEALDILWRESFKKLDFKYCHMFLSHMANLYVGEEVILSDDRSCRVLKVDVNNLLNPMLLHDNALIDLVKEKDIYVKRFVI